jgi:hypothetical protein
MSSVITMRGSGTGGNESALVSIDVPQDGFLLGCWITHSAELDADGDSSLFQISFGSASSSVNDSRQIICESRVAAQLTTSGSPMTGNNYYVDFHNGLPVGAGERIYGHVIATASLPTGFSAWLVFSFDEPRARARRS